MFFGINWKVRIKNPTWWVQVAVAIFLPILTYFGLNFEDMTTWQKLGDLLLEALKNPVVFVSVLVSVWNAVIDPTTQGVADSSRARQYVRPWSDKLPTIEN